MEIAARFSALARRDLPFLEYAREFCELAMITALDDATLNSLFWIGANYYRPVDLPDNTGLSWREGILRCLESVQPRSRTSPPSSSSAVPQSSPPSAAHVLLGILVAQSSHQKALLRLLGLRWSCPALRPLSSPS